MSKKIGLVLSGGSDRGSFQIGALKALKELGILSMISGVSGTSIGAINSLFAINGNIDEAEKIWLSMTPLRIFNPKSLFNKMEKQGSRGMLPSFVTQWVLMRMKGGIFSLQTLEKAIREHINLSVISETPISSYTTAVELDSMHKKVFSLNKGTSEQILDRTLASAALPVIFDPVQINGKYYVDGGLPAPYGENTPITPLIEQGFDVIIVIRLDEKENIPLNLYPNTSFIEIYPQKKLSAGMISIFTFNQKLTKERIALGYQDAKKVLSQYDTKKLLTI